MEQNLIKFDQISNCISQYGIKFLYKFKVNQWMLSLWVPNGFIGYLRTNYLFKQIFAQGHYILKPSENFMFNPPLLSFFDHRDHPVGRGIVI